MRMSLRSEIDKVLVVFGVVAIVMPVLLADERPVPFLVVLIGMCMIGVGTWRLGGRLLPDRREYLGLREEVDNFIHLVRRLNTHSTEGEIPLVESVRAEMHASVDRMVALAGRPG